jgi:eukaryotic-like serine/threonine-protein kinase
MIGTMIGEYRIVALLSDEGGMGAVYLGVHERIGRRAAIKALAARGPQAEFAARFENEARIQAALTHPHIAALYDFQVFDGQPFLVMEYVDGVTLAARLAAGGPLPLAEAWCIFGQVVEAVAYLHGRDVLHRDLKPANIKINAAGEVKLLDFGISKDAVSPHVTLHNHVVGTPPYLSPEQFETGRADRRSDVWALGVLLYEMLTGQLPFSPPAAAQTTAEQWAALAAKVTRGEYVAPSRLNPAIPREVEAVVARCLCKRPADRYASAMELQAALHRLEATRGSTRVERRDRRRYLPLAAGGAAGVLAAFSLGLVIAGGGEGPAPMPSPTSSVRAVSPRLKTEIQSIPAGAEVWRGGRLLGVTPYVCEGEEGEEVTLELRRENYQPYELTFRVSATRQAIGPVAMSLIESGEQ